MQRVAELVTTEPGAGALEVSSDPLAHQRSPYSGAVWFLSWIVLLLVALLRFLFPAADRLADPGQLRDALSQDNMALELRERYSFSVDWQRPGWLEAQPLDLKERELAGTWAQLGKGPTTLQAPLFPIWRSMGPQSGTWPQLINQILQWLVLATALAQGLVVAARRLRNGWLVPVGLLLMAMDPWLFWTSPRLPVNDLSVALVIGLLTALCTATDRGSCRSWAWVGGWLGLQVLNSNQALLWLVGLSLLWPLLLASWFISGRRISQFVFPSLCLAAVVAAIGAPWWVRNGLLTEGNAPWGCGLALQLTGGYGDEVLPNLGKISLNAVRNIESSIRGGPYFEDLTQPQREMAMAHLANRQTFGWISRKLSLLPRLAVWKVADHLNLTRRAGPWAWINGGLLLLAVAGCWLSRDALGFWILMVLLLSCLTTALTWSDGGFGSIPLRPGLHLAAAWALIRGVQALSGLRPSIQ